MELIEARQSTFFFEVCKKEARLGPRIPFKTAKSLVWMFIEVSVSRATC